MLAVQELSENKNIRFFTAFRCDLEGELLGLMLKDVQYAIFNPTRSGIWMCVSDSILSRVKGVENKVNEWFID